MNVDYELTYEIDPRDYMAMRAVVGWKQFSLEQAAEGLEHSYIWCYRDQGHPIAYGRIVWDHGYVVYIADLIVLPEYRGQGLGRAIMEHIMAFVREKLKPGYKMSVSLLSAKGKEAFYEKFGFVSRPTDAVGAGMNQWVTGE